MTSITLATVGTRPARLPMPLRWQPSELSRPTTIPADDGLVMAERVHLTLMAARLVVLALVGTGALAAGAFIGRL